MKFGGKLIFVFLSFQLSAQVPGWVIDSLIFETQQARACIRLDSSNQQTIFKQDELIEVQAIQLSNQKELISVQAGKIELFPKQMATQSAISKTEQAVLKARIKSLWKWVIGLGAFDVLLLVLLL